MKKNLKLLSLALVAALYFTSCENDSNTKPVEQSADLENTWETHDPNLIAKIDAEIDEKIATSKASTTVYRNFRLIVDANTPSDIIAFAKQEIDQMYYSGMKTSTIAKMDNVTGIYLAPTGSRGMYYSNSPRWSEQKFYKGWCVPSLSLGIRDLLAYAIKINTEKRKQI